MRKGFCKKLIATAIATMVTLSVIPFKVVNAAPVMWGSYGAGVGTEWPTQVYAPFVDIVDYYSNSSIANSGAAKLDKFYNDQGVKYFNIGFIQSRGSVTNGKVDWGFGAHKLLSEDVPNNEQYLGIKKSIRDIRNLGGDVCISFGGLTGTPFWKTTQDVNILANTYIDIVNGFGLTRLDLDIEEAGRGYAENVANAKAIKKLQDETGVAIGLTLPVLPDGLISVDRQTLQAYLENGVKLEYVNIMTMCYGTGVIPPGYNYGSASTLAVDALQKQLKEDYKKYANITLSDAEAYALIGTCPSVGFEGAAHPTWYPEWSKLVADHAIEKKIGMVTAWSMNRDSGIQANSGIRAPYEHTKEFKRFGTQEVIGGNKAPIILGVKDQVIKINSTFNPLAGVTATDEEDGDLTKSIAYSGTVNTAVEGDYKINYVVMDSGKKAATASATIKVRYDVTLDADLFDPTKVYNTGDIVVYKGALYKCNWWSQGGDPSTSPAWTKLSEPPVDPEEPVDPPAGISEDVNGDGKVDATDLALVAVKYNKKTSDTGFDAKCDINTSGLIDIFDIVMVSKKIEAQIVDPEPPTPTESEWKAGVDYKLGDIVIYEGKKYECINPHKSNLGWIPSAAFTLWKLKA